MPVPNPGPAHAEPSGLGCLLVIGPAFEDLAIGPVAVPAYALSRTQVSLLIQECSHCKHRCNTHMSGRQSDLVGWQTCMLL